MRTHTALLVLLAGTALAQSPPPSLVFDQDTVHEIRLTVTEPNWWQTLTDNYENNEDDVPYIPVSLVWGDYKVSGVGLRFKGNSSYNGARASKKKPFRIKLNEFTKGQKIDGMASFSLSNGWNDPSFVREKAYYEMAAAAGLKAPRSGFAALYINDEYYGLYILTEVVNGDFLKAFFGSDDDDGNLYKADIGASFSFLGADAAAYKNFFEKQSNEEADDWTDLIELSRIVGETPVDLLPAALEPIMDIDSVLTALALDNLTVNLDSYVGMGQNFYIYRRPSDHRWVWIPWDPSLAFGALGQGLNAQQLKELALEWTGSGFGGGGVFGGGGASGRPLATKLWQVPQYKQRYREIYARLAESSFVPSTLAARMNALRDMIRPWVAKDTQKLVTMEQFEAAMTADADSGAPVEPGFDPSAQRDLRLSAPALQPFLEGRQIAVKALLAGETPLNVTAAPASLAFAVVSGSTTAASRSVSVTPSVNSRTSTFTARSSAAWLTATPASGSVPGTIAISTSPAGLAVGSYSGSIILTIPGTTNSPLTIPTTLAVVASPRLVVTPATINLSALGGGGMTPSVPASRTLQVISTAPGTRLTVAVTTTSCGDFFAAAPTSATAPATITITANTQNLTQQNCSGSLTITATGMPAVTVPVTLTNNIRPPAAQFSIAAIVNGASYASGPVAPGEVVALYGRFGIRGGFPGAPGGQNPFVPTLTFDGVTAPVLYAGENQMTAVVPFTVAGKAQTAVRLSVAGQASEPLSVPVAETAPGIFTAASSGAGQASARNEDGTVNGPGNPAPKGSKVSLYLTGAGQTDPSGTAGRATGTNPIEKVLASISASIGGQPAQVISAGAAPASVQGVYRFDLIVPQASASGAVPVKVTAGTSTSQENVTVSVQ